MLESLERWRKAQLSAGSPNDWQAVDQLAIELAREGFANVSDTRSAVHLAICRLRGTTELPIEEGAPTTIWLEYLLHAILDALKEIERIRSIYYDLPFAAHSLSTDNKIVAVSQPWCLLLGYEAEEVIGLRSLDFLTNESRRLALTRYLPLFWNDGTLHKVEYVMVDKQGHEIPVFLSAAAEFDAHGRALRSFALVSERMQTDT